MNKCFFIFIIVLALSFNCTAETSCMLSKEGCKTSKGILSSKKIDEGKYNIYLNNNVILKLETNSMDEAFSYYDLPYHKNNNNEKDLILIKYNGNDCKIDDSIVRCRKFLVIDLVKDVVISKSFYPPVLNDKLLYINWGSKRSKFIFENESVFVYKDGNIEMINSGYLAE